MGDTVCLDPGYGARHAAALRGPLAQDPQRDEDIERVCRWIENAGQAGYRALFYNFCILDHQRTAATLGRGGVSYSTFAMSEYDNETLSEAGVVSREEAIARAAYFLERVIPVAEECKVQMACHPSDPGIGVGKTYRGVARPLGMVEGFKKLIDLYDSPYNGLNFCQGCMSEALENPAEEIFDVIRYFGERKKIFNVHFRNIKGGLGKFVEVFPDEGDINMIRALKVYKDVVGKPAKGWLSSSLRGNPTTADILAEQGLIYTTDYLTDEWRVLELVAGRPDSDVEAVK